jgi:hypothetical protein
LAVAETVFTSAFVELRVAVATPAPFVVAVNGVSVFPVEGVTVNTTVAPATVLPVPSRAVTVIVDVLVPLLAVMVDGLTSTLDKMGEIVVGLIANKFDVALVGPVAVAVSL